MKAWWRKKELEKAMEQQKEARRKKQIIDPKGSDEDWVKVNDIYQYHLNLQMQQMQMQNVASFYGFSSLKTQSKYGSFLIPYNIFTEPLRPKAPISTEPAARLTQLIGWRQWRLKDGKLWSITANCCWEGPTLSAGKPAVDGMERVRTTWAITEPPPLQPEIGIMAYKKASAFQYSNTVEGAVYGSVYLWGSVAEHTHGYRAERATIRSLLLPSEASDQLEALQQRYQPESIAIYRSFTEQLEAL